MKRFGIIGAGRFGVALAESLVAGGAEVILLDRDREAVQAFAQTAVRAVEGDAANLRTLKDAGFESCEAVVVAIGDQMEGSVLATLNCKELGVGTIVAKAATEMHARVLERIGADVVVNPNRDRALRLAGSLMNRTPIDLLEIVDGFSVAEVVAPRALRGKTLIEGEVRKKYGVTVLAIRRRSSDQRAPRFTVVTDGSEMVEEKDILIVFGPDDNLDKLRNG